MRQQKSLIRALTSAALAVSMLLSMPVFTGAVIITGTAEEIVLSKTATETTDGSVKDAHGNVKQTYDIDLSVSGKRVYPGTPVDFVLAIDLSNSMTSGGSKNLEITKSAAASFINMVLQDTNTAARVSIVTYGTFARAYNFSTQNSAYANNWDLYGATKKTDVYYTKDKNKALAVLNNASFKPAALKPTSPTNSVTSYESGGTNTEAGFRVTRDVAETRNRPDAASIVVFMTDGIPTFRCSGFGVTGSGSSPSAADFNNAVAAAKALKQAGSDIYTVGLLTSYAVNSYQMKMANNLLSDSASYTVSGSGSNWVYTKNGGAYSTRYYPVHSASSADLDLSEIYTELSQKSFALASGTVTDTIPADFELIGENKADLISMGHAVTENADGTTTVAFHDILASEFISVLPTIKVQYKGSGYGTAYTNAQATYVGALYDATPFTKVFNKPVAGLIPATVNDAAEAKISKAVTIDVTANDLFTKDGFSVPGNAVSGYQIVLTDANGNETAYTEAQNGFSASVQNGGVIFSSSSEAAKTFYYAVKASVTPDSSYAQNNRAVLVSRPTPVVVTIAVPDDPALDLDGASYAYIFGYEPIFTSVKLPDGTVAETTKIQMGMDDPVTREQVAAMLTRMIDQAFDLGNTDYPLTDNIRAFENAWYERGLAYINAKGGFGGYDKVPTGAISRGEVAKLIAHGLNLTKTTEVAFTDIDQSPYAPYIKTVVAYGYMQGTGATTFDPTPIMTRAQFCALFNNIIGRNSLGLTARDKDGGEYRVTAETYGFSDMDPTHWAYDICLKATSAYDGDGYVDLKIRQDSIRNKLDQYKAQTRY